MRPGDVFAEAAIFDAGRYPVAARSFDHAALLVVPSAPFLGYLESRFDLVLLMLGSMSLRLRQLIHQITELKLKSTAQRLGGFLLGMTTAQSGKAAVRFPYDKKLVAEKLGMKPESLSRALAKLKKVGVVSEHDNAVSIADVVKLRRFCLEDDNE
jgi:CRP/FNR family transcriptional activator FtrB